MSENEIKEERSERPEQGDLSAEMEGKPQRKQINTRKKSAVLLQIQSLPNKSIIRISNFWKDLLPIVVKSFLEELPEPALVIKGFLHEKFARREVSVFYLTR